MAEQAPNKNLHTIDLSLERAEAGGRPYLGDYQTLVDILGEYGSAVIQRLAQASALEIGFDEKQKADIAGARELADVLLGQKPDEYNPVPGWNEPGQIDRFVAAQVNIDEADPSDTLVVALLFMATDMHNAAHMADAGAPEDDWKSAIDGSIDEMARLMIGIPFYEQEAEGIDEVETAGDED